MGDIVSFRHSGDMGDLIASLAAVKTYCEAHKCKAKFIMDASGGWMDKCVSAQAPNGLKFDLKAAQFLEPLLKIQPYIAEVKIDTWGHETDASTINLNGFRVLFCDPNAIRATNQNLMELHQLLLNQPLGYRGPWIDLKGAPITTDLPNGVLMSRSTRYQQAHIMWEAIIANLNRKQVPYSFMGTDLEYDCFKDCFRQAHPTRLKVDNAVQMALAISGAEEYICNGTLGYWIAVGIGHRCIVHEPGNYIPTTMFREREGMELPNVTYIDGMRVINPKAKEVRDGAKND